MKDSGGGGEAWSYFLLPNGFNKKGRYLKWKSPTGSHCSIRSLKGKESVLQNAV